MEKKYAATITDSSRELSFEEKIRVKDYVFANKIDSNCSIQTPLLLEVEAYAIVHIHNEALQDDVKDYDVVVIITPEGELYYTGSESFFTKFDEIYSTAKDSGYEGNLTIKVVKRPSKKREGKEFISCTM